MQVRVDIRRGLIVGMPNDPHCHQRVNAALIEHGHIVVPEVMRGQCGFHVLQDVVGAVHDLFLMVFTPFHAVGIQHQVAPNAPEGVQRNGLSLQVREDPAVTVWFILLEHRAQFARHRHKAISGLGLQTVLIQDVSRALPLVQ